MTTITLGYGPFEAPIGTSVAGVLVNVTAADGTSAGTEAIAALATSAAFVLAPGSYTVTAQAVDASGAPVGPAVSDSFDVAGSAPVTVTVQIPTSISAA